MISTHNVAEADTGKEVMILQHLTTLMGNDCNGVCGEDFVIEGV